MAENRETAELTILSSAFTPKEDPYRWGPGVRLVYSLHYVVTGSGYLVCDGRVHRVTKDSCFLIIPHALVHYYPDPEDPWEYAWVDFSGATAERLIGFSSFTREAPIGKAVPSVLKYFRMLVKEGSARDPAALCRHTAYLRLILASLLEMHPAREESKGPSIAEQATQDILRHYHDPEYSIGVLCSHLNISRASLHRHFLAELSATPGNHIARLRIAKARELLVNTSLPIQNVAFSVGFSDCLYFSKVFKSHTALSPTEYRQRHRN